METLIKRDVRGNTYISTEFLRDYLTFLRNEFEEIYRVLNSNNVEIVKERLKLNANEIDDTLKEISQEVSNVGQIYQHAYVDGLYDGSSEVEQPWGNLYWTPDYYYL